MRLPSAIVLAPLILSLAGCAGLVEGWRAPEVSLTGLRVKELSLGHQTFLATLAVRNPNDRALPIESLTYAIELEGQELATGSSRLERPIPAFGESQVETQAQGSLLGVAQYLPVLAVKEGPIAWRVSGKALVAGLPVALPFSRSGQVDADRLLGAL
jgi:LEA14-like dessication related protein